MIRTLILIAGFAAAAALSAAGAEQLGKEWKKCKPASGPSEVFYLPAGGPNDSAVVASEQTTCEGPKKTSKTFSRFRVWHMEGREYVSSPAQYDRILPFSRSDSFVLRDDGRWQPTASASETPSNLPMRSGSRTPCSPLQFKASMLYQ